MRSARITGWGTALPDKVVTNADLEAMLDTSDEWIVERSGIRERRVGGTTATLAVASGKAAMDKAGVRPSDIDLLILCTTTPDQQVPATSAVVQHELGVACGAFDINAACSGFVYGLVTAHQFVASGSIERVLLIGSETLSRITDWDDRSTAVLFADGAGAVVVSAADDADGGSHLLGWDLGCDGSARSILDADIGGFIHMEGREVFRRAVRVMIDSGKRAMEQAGVTARGHRARRPAPGEHPHHRVGERQARPADGAHRGRPRPHRQHVVRVDPARARRRDRPRSRLPRRPHHVRRLRRRHDMGFRDTQVGPVTEPRTVVVTGGTRGIGLACARAFAADGDRVAVLSRSSTTDEFPCFTCDVADAARGRRGVRQGRGRVGTRCGRDLERRRRARHVARAHEGRRMARGDRHEPHGSVQRCAPRHPVDDEGTLGTTRVHLVGRRATSGRRARRTTQRPKRASSASPGRSPVNTRAAGSPPTSSPPVPSRPT